MQITSLSGSAFVPCSVTTFPLRVTRPAAMISSALRREAMPDAAMIFCSLSAGMVLGALLFLKGLLLSGFFFAGHGSSQRIDFVFPQQAISAARNPFHGERPPSDALQLFE